MDFIKLRVLKALFQSCQIRTTNTKKILYEVVQWTCLRPLLFRQTLVLVHPKVESLLKETIGTDHLVLGVFNNYVS